MKNFFKNLSVGIGIILSIFGVSQIAFGSQVYGPAVTSTIVPTGALNMGGFPITNADAITGTIFNATSTTATSTFASGIRITSPNGNYTVSPQIEFGTPGSGNGLFMNGAGALNIDIMGTTRVAVDTSGIGTNQTNAPWVRNAQPSATTPGFAFNNDLTTGIGRSAAGVMHLITNSNTALTASSTGSTSNILIGSTSLIANGAYRPLTVNSTAGTAVVTQFSNSDGSGVLSDWITNANNADGGFRFINNGSGATSFSIGYDGTKNSFKVGRGAAAPSGVTNDLAVAGATGYVGIGSSTPPVPLYVAGNTNIAGTLNLVDTGGSGQTARLTLQQDGSAISSINSVQLFIDNLHSSAPPIIFRQGAGATERMRIAGTTGNLGISTTSPYAKLSVHAKSNETNTTLFAIASSTANATTTLFTVSNAGLVGIGPGADNSALLDVHQAGNAIPMIQAQDSNANSATSGGIFQATLDNGTAPTSGTRLGGYQWSADIGDAVKRVGAAINALATETWSSVANGTQLRFNITKNGTTARTTAMTIDQSGLIGIGTTTPDHLLNLQGSAGTTDAFNIASSTFATMFAVDYKGHLASNVATPVLSSCGTSPAITGNDKWGTVTAGGTATGCTVTFYSPYKATPSCTVTPETGSVTNTFSYSLSSSAITVTETGLGGNKFDYVCGGNEQ